jgi:ubiquinone/menaquinone biosynthesis C-methylase UbiE
MTYTDDIKDRVEKAYKTSAEFYTETMENTMTYWSNVLLRDLQLPEYPKALDVGCGTGISTLELMKKCDFKGEFHGIDLSQEMVDKADQMCREKGYNGHFSKCDAENLKHKDDTFDLVISNLALHWVPDKKKAFSEIFRVLKPGGQMAVLFNGDLNFKEAIDLCAEIENRHPELISEYQWMGWRNFQKQFLSLGEVNEIVYDVGFATPRIHANHRENYGAETGMDCGG